MSIYTTTLTRSIQNVSYTTNGGDIDTRNIWNSTVLGYLAGLNSSGYDNTFVGTQAGKNNTTGSSNVFLGNNAGFWNVNGSANMFLGAGAGYANQTGANNVFIGLRSGSKNVTGTQNVMIGNNTGQFLNGNNNVVIGFNNTSTNQGFSSSNNISIGTNGKTNGFFNIAIGNETFLQGEDTILIGNNSTDVYGNSVVVGNNIRNLGSNAFILMSGCNGDKRFINTSNNYMNINNLIIAESDETGTFRYFRVRVDNVIVGNMSNYIDISQNAYNTFANDYHLNIANSMIVNSSNEIIIKNQHSAISIDSNLMLTSSNGGISIQNTTSQILLTDEQAVIASDCNIFISSGANVRIENDMSYMLLDDAGFSVINDLSSFVISSSNTLLSSVPQIDITSSNGICLYNQQSTLCLENEGFFVVTDCNISFSNSSLSLVAFPNSEGVIESIQGNYQVMGACNVTFEAEGDISLSNTTGYFILGKNGVLLDSTASVTIVTPLNSFGMSSNGTNLSTQGETSIYALSNIFLSNSWNSLVLSSNGVSFNTADIQLQCTSNFYVGNTESYISSSNGSLFLSSYCNISLNGNGIIVNGLNLESYLSNIASSITASNMSMISLAVSNLTSCNISSVTISASNLSTCNLMVSGNVTFSNKYGNFQFGTSKQDESVLVLENSQGPLFGFDANGSNVYIYGTLIVANRTSNILEDYLCNFPFEDLYLDTLSTTVGNHYITGDLWVDKRLHVGEFCAKHASFESLSVGSITITNQHSSNHTSFPASNCLIENFWANPTINTIFGATYIEKDLNVEGDVHIGGMLCAKMFHLANVTTYNTFEIRDGNGFWEWSVQDPNSTDPLLVLSSPNGTLLKVDTNSNIYVYGNIYQINSNYSTDSVFTAVDYSGSNDVNSCYSFSNHGLTTGELYSGAVTNSSGSTYIQNHMWVNGKMYASHTKTIQAISEEMVCERLQAGVKIRLGHCSNYWDHYVDHESNQNNLVFQSRNGSVVTFTDEFAPEVLNFTGKHRCKLKGNAMNKTKYIGKIVVSNGHYENLFNTSTIIIDEALPVVQVAKYSYDPKAIGVIGGFDDNGSFRLGNLRFEQPLVGPRVIIQSLGEGAIWVCNVNGNLKNGDFVTSSSIKGYGMRQGHPYRANYTVAKITCDCSFDLKSRIYKCKAFVYKGQTMIRAFVGCIYTC
jgi:hypothetical protein